MTRIILVTFFFMAVSFYELSGGAAFVPEQRVAAVADDLAETVTRADTVSLAALTEVVEPAFSVSLSEPLIAAPVVAQAPELAPELAADPTIDPVVAAVVEQVAAAPALDLRQVSAEMVNVREGPGTDYPVLDRLVLGTRTEVLEVEASGWAHVRVIDTGLLGWVSAEYLASENG